MFRGDEVLSSVFRLERLGAPPVTLIGGVGMGPLHYYRSLEGRLTQGTDHFAGYERLHDQNPDNTGLGRYGRKLGNVRDSIPLRRELAQLAGLRTRQTVAIGPCTSVDQSMQDAARLMSLAEAFALARHNRRMRQALESGTDQQFRLNEYVGQYFLNLRALNNEHTQQRIGPWEKARAEQVLSYLLDAVGRGQEARQIVGITRLAELVKLLKAHGYTLMGDIDWEPCTNMKLWRP